MMNIYRHSVEREDSQPSPLCSPHHKMFDNVYSSLQRSSKIHIELRSEAI